MNAEKYVLLGRWTAIISFLCGTILFAWYFISSESNLLFIGYLFIVIVGCINLGVLIAVSTKLSKEGQKKQLVKICLFMLLNIPVMFIYCWVAAGLLNTMRITFTNSTSAELNNIQIRGCESQSITYLEPGDSETVWINIPSDCQIDIAYVLDGQQTKETVVGYTTTNNGGMMKHKIGGVNEPEF